MFIIMMFFSAKNLKKGIMNTGLHAFLSSYGNII